MLILPFPRKRGKKGSTGIQEPWIHGYQSWDDLRRGWKIPGWWKSTSKVNTTSSFGLSLLGEILVPKLGLENGETYGIPDQFGLEGTLKTISFPGWNIPWKGNFHKFHILQMPLLSSEFLAQRFIPSFPHSMECVHAPGASHAPLWADATSQGFVGISHCPIPPTENLRKLKENLKLGIISHLSQADPCPSG